MSLRVSNQCQSEMNASHNGHLLATIQKRCLLEMVGFLQSSTGAKFFGVVILTPIGVQTNTV